MKYIKKLLGEKIYLSPGRNIEDAKTYTNWLNDFNTTDYVARSHGIVTLESEEKYLEDSNNNDSKAIFSIIELETDKLVGTISLEEINHRNRVATLGIFIGDIESRNKGYGSEAINLILDFGFNYLNLLNIRLSVLEFNKTAYSCYTKCGFKEYGRRRKCNFVNGKYYDVIYMDILADEFKGDFIKNKNI